VRAELARKIGRLMRKSLLPARDGTRFPLTDDEMRWHLGYFGVPT
jgi:hypothetical protein